MKKLSALLPDGILSALSTEQQHIEVKRLSLDSRDVLAGDCFFAYPGTEIDRRDFIELALQKGAAVVLAESKDVTVIDDPRIIYLPHLQDMLSHIAAAFYDHPSQQLKVFGVTGTNGKTSCVWLLVHALQALGAKATGIGPLFGSELTTPDPITLQKLLRQFVDNGIQYVGMEVSSHALDQHRVDAVRFDVTAFTNLTQDHLDYHHTMSKYFAAKQRLFELGSTTAAIVNVGNDYGQLLLTRIQPFNTNLVPVRVKHVKATDRGADFLAEIDRQPWQQHMQLLGSFNAENLTIVIAALLAWNFDVQAVHTAVALLGAVRGRVECRQVNGVNSVLDYAHTPDALKTVLQNLRHLTAGQLICVFGCGGNRDHEKRAIMGKVAAQLADKIIVTSDNPRDEEPMTIIQQILGGVTDQSSVVVEPDRAYAIELAYEQAKPGDCVLVAGKGHEAYQVINGTKHAFDDRQYMRGFDEIK